MMQCPRDDLHARVMALSGPWKEPQHVAAPGDGVLYWGHLEPPPQRGGMSPGMELSLSFSSLSVCWAGSDLSPAGPGPCY